MLNYKYFFKNILFLITIIGITSGCEVQNTVTQIQEENVTPSLKNNHFTEQQVIDVNLSNLSVDQIGVISNPEGCQYLVLQNGGGRLGLTEFRDSSGNMVCGTQKKVILNPKDFYVKSVSGVRTKKLFFDESLILVHTKGVEYLIVRNGGGKMGIAVNYDKTGSPILGKPKEK